MGWSDFDAMGLGLAVRHEWEIDPGFLTVNHGSYGATPRRVMAVQRQWQSRMEAQTTRFMTLELPSALREAAAGLARYLGAAPADLVFVENATTGCNAVLRSLELAAGDEILMLDHGYGAVVKTAEYVAQRGGARVVRAPLPFPRPDDDAIVANIAAGLTARTRIAVLDHITSPSAVVLPMERIIAVCRAAGVPVLVDAAHVPGHLPLDLRALDADWVVGNAHKWLFAPKGCAFLWARADRQEGLHPVTISHGYGQGFVAEFDWTGTRDMSAYLAVTAALAFHQRLGGAQLQRRNQLLATEAALMLAEAFGTETGVGNGTACAMAVVRLPVSGPVDAQRALALRARLLGMGTDAPVSAIDGQAWLRISAQAYNDMADYEALAKIALQLA